MYGRLSRVIGLQQSVEKIYYKSCVDQGRSKYETSRTIRSAGNAELCPDSAQTTRYDVLLSTKDVDCNV